MKNTCCQPVYDVMFNQQKAEKELNDYLRTGVKKSSRPIIKALQKLPLAEKTLLDIGGGFGVITFELLKRNVKKSTHVDISNAYIKTFLAEAKRQSIIDKIRSLQGDFIKVSDQVDHADLVTLDKVICCYQDYNGLVRASVSKANQWYVYTIPRSVWWVKLVHGLETLYNKIRGDAFRSYIHPTDVIENLVLKSGFKKIHQHYQREWLVAVFEKEA